MRRVCGEEIDAGLALEYIAGEFLATYQARVEQDIVPEHEAEIDDDVSSSRADDVTFRARVGVMRSHSRNQLRRPRERIGYIVTTFGQPHLKEKTS